MVKNNKFTQFVPVFMEFYLIYTNNVFKITIFFK